ncbi:MAG: hypothetical protein HRT61_21345 [Ekhidna sp.]|nr:hypothetical protein [Ekhidna sp.]
MIKTLKSVSRLLPTQALGKSAEVQNAKKEAEELMQRELHMVLEKLKQVPEDRLPSPKIAKSLSILKGTVSGMLQSVGKELVDLSEASKIDEVDDLRKKLSLERYASLVSSADKVTPFATFYEIRKLVDEADLKKPELYKAYGDALSALFGHNVFEETLLGRISKKTTILGESAGDDSNMERKKVVVFLENYSVCKALNPSLQKNANLEAAIDELTSIVYLQNQKQALIDGTMVPTVEVKQYINNLMVYLNGLTAKAQQNKIVLLTAADECSEAFNAACANLPQ